MIQYVQYIARTTEVLEKGYKCKKIFILVLPQVAHPADDGQLYLGRRRSHRGLSIAAVVQPPMIPHRQAMDELLRALGTHWAQIVPKTYRCRP